MSTYEERNLILRIIKYALENDEVTLNSLHKGLKLAGDDADYLRTHLINWRKEAAPNHILTVPYVYEDGQILPDTDLQVLPNALFSYIDHLEIVQARAAAKEARRLSWYAIWISILMGAASTFIGFYQLYLQRNC